MNRSVRFMDMTILIGCGRSRRSGILRGNSISSSQLLGKRRESYYTKMICVEHIQNQKNNKPETTTEIGEIAVVPMITQMKTNGIYFYFFQSHCKSRCKYRENYKHNGVMSNILQSYKSYFSLTKDYNRCWLSDAQARIKQHTVA